MCGTKIWTTNLLTFYLKRRQKSFRKFSQSEFIAIYNLPLTYYQNVIKIMMTIVPENKYKDSKKLRKT